MVEDVETAIARGLEKDGKPQKLWQTNQHLELIPNTDSQLIDPTERRAADTVERQRQLAPGLFGRK